MVVATLMVAAPATPPVKLTGPTETTSKTFFTTVPIEPEVLKSVFAGLPWVTVMVTLQVPVAPARR